MAKVMKSSVSWNIMPCSLLKQEQSRQRATYSVLVSVLAYPSTLKMEVIYSSETSVDFEMTTRHYFSRD
jgi:hypothetical protein